MKALETGVALVLFLIYCAISLLPVVVLGIVGLRRKSLHRFDRIALLLSSIATAICMVIIYNRLRSHSSDFPGMIALFFPLYEYAFAAFALITFGSLAHFLKRSANGHRCGICGLLCLTAFAVCIWVEVAFGWQFLQLPFRHWYLSRGPRLNFPLPLHASRFTFPVSCRLC